MTVPLPLETYGPEQEAKKIINTMSESLVDQFEKKSLRAQRLSLTNSVLPHAGWLIQGVFTEVDEGNRIK